MTAVIINAKTAILGAGSDTIEDATLVAIDGVIRSIGPRSDARLMHEPRDVYDFPEHCLLPGLIDTHVHLILPGDGSPAERFVQSRTDMELLLVAQRNAEHSLAAGITTMRDVGSRGRIAMTLRDAIDSGLAHGPRLLVSGSPITITGGHCHYMGGEADGVEGVRLKARTILKDGADCIKLMGSGGATPGTCFWHPNFSAAEVRTAVEESHRRGARITVHATCLEAVEAAMAAQVDMIEHASMWIAATTGPVIQYKAKVADALAQSGTFIGRTLQATYGRLCELQQREQREALTQSERSLLESRLRIFEHAMDSFGRLRTAGVQLVAGTDAGWDVTPFGHNYVTGLELAADAGMPAWEVIEHATSRAAKAIGLEGKVGMLAPGQAADLLLVAGDPYKQIGVMRHPAAVFQGGRLVSQGSQS